MVKKVLHIALCLLSVWMTPVFADLANSDSVNNRESNNYVNPIHYHTFRIGDSFCNSKYPINYHTHLSGDSAYNVPPIDTVFIKVQRSDFASVGRFKSIISTELQTGLLHERMTENASFFKQYGVSGSSTVSKRGADATQTQVVWNGLPINHPMLGMTDFNGISSFAFSEIFMIEGGNSALFGSGSVGGTIFLNNQSQFETPLKVSLLQQSSSLNNHRSGFDLKNSWRVKSGNRWFLQATLSSINDYNQFQFQDQLSGQTEIQWRNNIHSDLQNRSGRVVLAFKSKKAVQWKWVTEQTHVFRELGTLYGSTKFIGAQWDRNTRSILEIKKGFDRWGISQKLGYTRDNIVFQDELNVPQNPKNRDTSVATMHFAQTELYFKQSLLGDFIVGFDIQNQVGRSPYFGGKDLVSTSQNRCLPAQFLGWKRRWTKMEFLSNFRFEWLEKVATYGLSGEYLVVKNHKIRFDAHSHFRRPTLNDQFWYSPDALKEGVKSETGWATELGWNTDWKSSKHGDRFNQQTAFYYRELNNPIIWTPTGAFWSARNFYFGRYFGLQSEGKWVTHGKNVGAWISYHFDAVNAQVKRTEKDAYFQQIFIPDFMGNLETGIAIKRHQISIKASHTGNRFIQTDNQNWLPGYRLFSLEYQWNALWLKQPIVLGFSLQNATNTVYQNMPGRPMPPRFVGVKINYEITKHNAK